MSMIIRCLAALVLVTPSLASAHVAMTSPTPRNGENNLTTGPCGDVAAGKAPTVFTAGETISVAWEVGQSHGGALRIDFASADDTGFEMNVVAMDVADGDDSPIMMDIELPDIECEACTLRVTQLNPDEDDYYSCADVQLLASEGSTGTSDGDSGDEAGGDSTGGGGGETTGGDTTGGGDGADDGDTTGDASADGNADDSNADDSNADDGNGDGATSGDTDGATSGGAEDDDDGGGCSVPGSGAPAGWLVIFGIAALAWRRQRG